jgi:hypothetical protein
MHRFGPRTAFGITFAAVVIALAGCSSEKLVEVSGKVTYNGAPLKKPGGQIVFVGPKGTEALAKIEENGTFKAARVSAGLNRIAVYYVNPDAVGKHLPDPAKKGKAAPPATAFITPQKYASVESSNLQVEVGEGTVFNADMIGPKIQ